MIFLTKVGAVNYAQIRSGFYRRQSGSSRPRSAVSFWSSARKSRRVRKKCPSDFATNRTSVTSAMLSAALIFLLVEAAATVLGAPHIQGYRDDPFVTETSTARNHPLQNETQNVTDEYDQRQNGSENYRINVKGVVVLLAPAETILAAANLPSLEGELGSFKPPKPTTENTANLDHAPEIESSLAEGCEGGKCNSSNGTVKQRGKLKMMSNILQLFRNLNEDVAHV